SSSAPIPAQTPSTDTARSLAHPRESPEWQCDIPPAGSDDPECCASQTETAGESPLAESPPPPPGKAHNPASNKSSRSALSFTFLLFTCTCDLKSPTKYLRQKGKTFLSRQLRLIRMRIQLYRQIPFIIDRRERGLHFLPVECALPRNLMI